MATLTGQFISQSYGGLIQLSTNTGITTGSNTQLQDGLGTNLGVFLNGQGDIAAADISLTGSAYLIPISANLQPFPIIEAVGTNTAAGARGNLILSRNTFSILTGSVIVSGSNNLIALNSGANNSTIAAGYGSGWIADNSVILGQPWISSGSFGSGYDRRYPSVAASIILSNNGGWEIRDNRPSGSTGNSILLNGAIFNGNGTLTTSTGSINFNASIINGASNNLTRTGSVAGSTSLTGTLINGNSNRVTIDTNESGFGVEAAAILGQSNELYISGSFIRGNAVQMLGQGLVATGSANLAAQFGGAYVGRFNAADSTSQLANTALAVGTGTSTGARRTSLHVSSSGLTTVRDSLVVTGSLIVGTTTPELTVLATGVTLGNVITDVHTVTGSLSVSGSLNAPSITGSLLGTASFATSASFATTASFALNVTPISTGSFATTGSNTFVGNQTISGSVSNEVKALTITSQTASLDLSTGNLFTLSLVNGVNTHISASNIQRGQTTSLQITQGTLGTGTVTFSSAFSFPSGSSYVAFASSSAVDLISFISFDGTRLRAVAQNNFI